jgi:hypothetical protein
MQALIILFDMLSTHHAIRGIPLEASIGVLWFSFLGDDCGVWLLTWKLVS